MTRPANPVDEAEAIVRWAFDKFPTSLAMTSAFGLNGVALIHLVYAELDLRPPVLFVDTGYMFPETLETRDRVVARYGLDLRQVGPVEVSSGILPTAEACCQQRKVEPMRRLLAEITPGAILTGRGRFQAVTRRQLQMVEWGRFPLRVNPLANWSQEDVEGYVKANDVPYNPLYDAGYYSVGCVPCTRAVEPGEDVRAGRWDGLGKVECGLWR